MKRLMLLVVLLIILVPSTRAQNGIRIEVDPGDTPLVITGWLSEANAFVGNLRLTAHGGDVDGFIVLPSDLKKDEELIGRQNVSLVGDPTLTADIPKDFQVSVTGLEKPGTYTGYLEILIPGRPRSEALKIDLTVVAKARPVLNLQPGTENLQLRLVNCGQKLNCSLARLLLPASAFLDTWNLQFENTVQADVTILDTEVVVLGEQTGYQLAETELILPQDQQKLLAGQMSALPLELERSKIPPDHYTGNIYLTLEGRDERLAIPVDLSVRKGPFWPLVALLFGIIVGRLFKYMQERGGPQAEALEAVNEMAVQIGKADPEDQKILAPMVDTVRQLVYQEKLENIQTQLDTIGNRLKVLQGLRDIEVSLKGKEQHPKAQEALGKITQAREHIKQKEDEKATALIEELPKILGEIGSSLMGAGERDIDNKITKAKEQAEEATTAMQQVSKAPPPPPIESAGWQNIKRTLVALSGLSDEIRAEATLWLVRPLLYLVLLLGLLAVGIGSLYVDNGLTFGATPFSDYLGLVLWGLSADVASRSLSNLQGRGAGA